MHVLEDHVYITNFMKDIRLLQRIKKSLISLTVYRLFGLLRNASLVLMNQGHFLFNQ